MIVCGDVLDPNHPELSVSEDGRTYWPSKAAIPKTSSLQSLAAYLAFKVAKPIGSADKTWSTLGKWTD